MLMIIYTDDAEMDGWFDGWILYGWMVYGWIDGYWQC